MVFVPQAANWLLLLFLFQISCISAFYAEKRFAPIQQPKGKGVDSDQDTGNDVKHLTDDGHALDGQAVGLPEEGDGVQSDKRRLGSALNIGRGRGQKAMTNGKRLSDDGEFGERFFQVYGKAARGQPLNNENKQQLAQGYGEQMADEEEEEDTSDVDRRNIGSAMNLIKVRKNNFFRISPSGDAFEGERERRRLGSAMNLKKVTDNRLKSRLIRD